MTTATENLNKLKTILTNNYNGLDKDELTAFIDLQIANLAHRAEKSAAKRAAAAKPDDELTEAVLTVLKSIKGPLLPEEISAKISGSSAAMCRARAVKLVEKGRVIKVGKILNDRTYVAYQAV